MLITKHDIIYSTKDWHWSHGSWLQKSSGLQNLAKENKQKQMKINKSKGKQTKTKENKQKQRKTKIYKKNSRHEICNKMSWFSTEKERWIFTDVIIELEHKHRTGFLFHGTITNKAVFTPGTTDPGESVHGGVPQNLCCHQVFLSEIGENVNDSKSEWQDLWLCFGIWTWKKSMSSYT